MTGLDIARSLDPTALPETHYSVLGIEPTAAPEQVQDAYEQSIEEIRAESLAAYSLVASEEVERQLQQVSRAYMELINPHTRNEYDQELLTKAITVAEPEPPEPESAKVVPPEKMSHRREPSSKVVFLNTANRFFGPPQKGIAKPDSSMSAVPTPTSADNSSAFVGQVHQRHSTYQQLNAKVDSARKRVQVYLEHREAEGIPLHFDGPTLRDIRNLAEVTFEELTAVTCVRQVYLEALESENYEALPAEIYLKGYLSSYARALELPKSRVQEEYLSRYRAQKKRR
jgi:hypothetical protein